MDYQTLVLDEHDGILTVTVHRPPARNALSQQTLTELRHLLTHFAGPRAVLLTGSEGPAFIAGADIREMAAMTPEEGETFGALGQEVTRLLEQLPVPVIACVDGYALGGGCEMAMACDFVYATRKAVFGQPEVLLGLIPGFGGCVRLFRRVGVAKARELIYSGRRVDAVEAHRLGLVNDVFDSREEMFTAARLVLADHRGQLARRRLGLQVGDQRRGRPGRRGGTGGRARRVPPGLHHRRHARGHSGFPGQAHA
ncbi:enoyl-CoA hydratase-related protein [Lentzea indica]|uniref:enoyl-CoA hydratase-related protein n=1 Tax=Lentzea indica TaxID=2604800 RepID=UPI001CB6C92F|nr:enoyl-CoA hydratase-related protein [Lentzea indica]